MLNRIFWFTLFILTGCSNAPVKDVDVKEQALRESARLVGELEALPEWGRVHSKYFEIVTGGNNPRYNPKETSSVGVVRDLSDEDHPHGVVQICPKADFFNRACVWKDVWQPEAVGEHFSFSVSYVTPGGEGLMLKISPKGGDFQYYAELSLETGQLLEGPNAFRTKYEEGARVFGAYLGPDIFIIASSECPPEGYDAKISTQFPGTIRAWKRGQSLCDAPVILANTPETPWGALVPEWGGSQEEVRVALEAYPVGQNSAPNIFVYQVGATSTSLYEIPMAGSNGDFLGWSGPHKVFLSLNKNWEEFIEGDILEYDYVQGSAHLVYRHESKRAMTYIAPAWVEEGQNRQLLVTLIENGKLSLVQRDCADEGGRFKEVKIPGSEGGILYLVEEALEYNGQQWVIVHTEGPVTPLNFGVYNPATGEYIRLFEGKNYFDEGYRVSSGFVPSADGAINVPYTLSLPPGGAKVTTCLMVEYYAGFGIPYVPVYESYESVKASLGGCAIVTVSARGGSDIPNGHEMAKGQHWKTSVPDIVSVVRYLHSQGISQPALTVGFGGSHGGYISALLGLLYPDVFGMVFATHPVLDLSLFLEEESIGTIWRDEYGDQVWTHNPTAMLAVLACEKVETLPLFFANTAENENRAVPDHVFNFFAAMKAATDRCGVPLSPKLLVHVSSGAVHGSGETPWLAARNSTVEALVFWRHLQQARMRLGLN